AATFSAWRHRRAYAVRPGVPAADDNDFFGGRENGLAADLWLVGYATILLRPEIHREMDAGKLATGNGQIARLFAVAGEHDGIVLLVQFVHRDGDLDIRVVMKD